MARSGQTTASDSRNSSRRLLSSSAMTALSRSMRHLDCRGQTAASLDIDRDGCAVAIDRTQTLACLAEYRGIANRPNRRTATDDPDAEARRFDDRLDPDGCRWPIAMRR